MLQSAGSRIDQFESDGLFIELPVLTLRGREPRRQRVLCQANNPMVIFVVVVTGVLIRVPVY